MASPQPAKPPTPRNPTPKQRFQQTAKFVAEHRQLVDSAAFERAVDFAEAQYVNRLCELTPASIDSSSNIQASAACFQRILGMHEFLNILRNLSERPLPPTPKSTDNLQHQL